MSSGQNGKGSKRRPTQVSDEELEENWLRVFGPRKVERREASVDPVRDALVKDYTAATEWKIPSEAEILGFHARIREIPDGRSLSS